MIIINEDRCDLCGVCIGVCPENCMEMGAAYLEINDDVCTLCNRCILICPVSALELYETKQPI